ncbi:hypothetical protein MPER_00561 [Moniliophthora perniciosa FA553]|nr:hypothetical protein MPER_00561 [Moniliophthora perniciosa FA553]
MNIDLGKKETCGFVEMLKALIARTLMNDEDISIITADPSSEEASKVKQALTERANGRYKDLISSAITFCNKDLGPDANEKGKGKGKGKGKEEGDVDLCHTMKESLRK